jgi:hypothetical protein
VNGELERELTRTPRDQDWGLNKRERRIDLQEGQKDQEDVWECGAGAASRKTNVPSLVGLLGLLVRSIFVLFSFKQNS